VETGGWIQNVVEKITRKIFSVGSQRLRNELRFAQYNMEEYGIPHFAGAGWVPPPTPQLMTRKQ